MRRGWGARRRGRAAARGRNGGGKCRGVAPPAQDQIITGLKANIAIVQAFLTKLFGAAGSTREEFLPVATTYLDSVTATLSDLALDINEANSRVAQHSGKKAPKPWSTPWDATVKTKLDALIAATGIEDAEVGEDGEEAEDGAEGAADAEEANGDPNA